MTVLVVRVHVQRLQELKTCHLKDTFSFPVALRPNAGHGLLILEVSRTKNDGPQSVGLLWTSDQLVAETST